ncbi:uncharacterized protein [Arachis hypogaea]|uniref:uncharacterized protein n=1 Tax=Arachis hypogaea TaxID=3818 RepID=UPI003B20E485
MWQLEIFNYKENLSPPLPDLRRNWSPILRIQRLSSQPLLPGLYLWILLLSLLLQYNPLLRNKRWMRGIIYSRNFDAMAWDEENILPHHYVSTDNVALQNHLQTLTRGGLRTVGVCATLARELRGTPIQATASALVAARADVERLNEIKNVMEQERETLRTDLERAQERLEKLDAAAALAEEKMKSDESYTRVFREKVQEELEKMKERCAELEESVALVMDEMFENLKAQIKVLAPDLNFSLFSTDNIVVDSKIVPAPKEDENEPPFNLKTSGPQVGQTSTSGAQSEVIVMETSSLAPAGILVVPVSARPLTPSAKKDVVTGKDLTLV